MAAKGLGDSEIQALNRFPDELFPEFLMITFDLMTSENNSETFILNLEEFCNKLGANPSGIKNLTKSLICYFQDAVKRSLPANVVSSLLSNLGLSADKCAVLEETWTERYLALTQIMVNKTFMSNRLVDMEWKFGVTAANSESNEVGQSYLQLKFKVADRSQAICMELTLPQFYTFLHEMEKAQSNLNLLQ